MGWKDSIGWYRIAELFSNRDADSILMEFNFMPAWGNGSTSSSKVEVIWLNRTEVILENTKNIKNIFNELQYDGIRIYKSNDKTDTIYIDLHVPRANHIIFSVCQYTTNNLAAYATILNPCIYMNNEELDASAYTLLKQININKTSDTYTSTLSRISALESKVSALENSGS